jgi:hypothetical protein
MCGTLKGTVTRDCFASFFSKFFSLQCPDVGADMVLNFFCFHKYIQRYSMCYSVPAKTARNEFFMLEFLNFFFRNLEFHGCIVYVNQVF